jgi:hypothetical protein
MAIVTTLITAYGRPGFDVSQGPGGAAGYLKTSGVQEL